MIKRKLSERLTFILRVLNESAEAERNGDTYHAACLAASARDSMTVLNDLVNGLACALSEDGYDNPFFNDLADRCAKVLAMTVVRLGKLETSLKG